MSVVRAPRRAGQKWTAKELRGMPPSERDAILRAAAKRAEADYRGDRKLTDFEAFGKEDLHGDSANAEAR
jgi:hypothetical protein